jgi:hypothetical protein
MARESAPEGTDFQEKVSVSASGAEVLRNQRYRALASIGD